MAMFVLFVSATVSFDGVFFLWLSLISPKLIGQKSLPYGHYWKKKRLKSTFLTGFASLELTTKEDLNPQKQVLLFEALVYPEANNWVYFLQENVYIKKICSVKAKGFCLKFNTFPHLLVLSVSQILLHLLWPGDWHLTSNK